MENKNNIYVVIKIYLPLRKSTHLSKKKYIGTSLAQGVG